MDDDALLKAFNEAEDDFSEMQQLLRKASEPRYQDEKLTGEGGAKYIYTSRDMISGRLLARAFPKEPIFKDDFLREAQLHSHLEHPNILPIYDIGIEDDKPFFTMKLILGDSLEKFVEKNKNKLSDSSYQNTIIDIFLKIGDALSYAHSREILHLDLKPDNIHLSQFGEVLVGDWGLARVQGQTEETQEYTNHDLSGQFTRYGYLNGTPGFMAPEQCTKGQDKSAVTDIYSLGILLVYLFTAETPTKGNQDEQIQATLKGRLNVNWSKIPLGLHPLIRKSLALKPNQRYQSVKQLTDDINAYRSGYLTSADKHSTQKLLRALYKRNRRAFTVTTSFLTSILILTSLFVYSLQKSRNKALRSEQNAQNALASQQETLKEKERIAREFATDYLQASIGYYHSPERGRHNYYPHRDKKAYKLVTKALELKKGSPLNWALKGRVAMLTNRLNEAEQDFIQAGDTFEVHAKVCKKYKNLDIQNVKILSQMLAELNESGDLRLIHDFMFKTIFSKITLNDHIYFAEHSMNLRNPHPSQKLNFSFDKEQWALDLSGNPQLRYIFVIKNLPLRQLDLSSSSIINDFYHLEKMPLVKLNLSNTQINNQRFKPLLGKPIRDLDISKTKMRFLKPLKDLPLEVLNIQETNIHDLSSLNLWPNLRKVICSQKNKKQVTKILRDKNVEIITD